MKIEKDAVVTLAYTLKDQSGSILDQSDEQTPLAYLHGHNNLVPGLEEKLTGASKGDKLQVELKSAEAYGDRNDELVHVVTRKQFEDAATLEVGMQFEAPVGDESMLFTIVAIDKENITVDGNHPLAGVDLNFSVTVLDIRKPTPEELAHGHVHGAGGHEH